MRTTEIKKGNHELWVHHNSDWSGEIFIYQSVGGAESELVATLDGPAFLKLARVLVEDDLRSNLISLVEHWGNGRAS